jgi:hypothetical protein
MPVLDERGRLFGRINLVDAAVVGFVLVLVPLGFALYLLFRESPPIVDAVAPARIAARLPARVLVTGRNLRPFLRVRVGATIVGTMLVETPTQGEIKLPALAPGTYDLVLFDVVQEVARVPAAIKVDPDPAGAANSDPNHPVAAPSQPGGPKQMIVQAVGEFERLSANEAAQVRPALDLGQVGRVLAVQPGLPGVRRLRTGPGTFLIIPAPDEVRVPAIVHLVCEIILDACRINNRLYTTLESATVELPFPGSLSLGTEAAPQISFFVREVRPSDAAVSFAANSAQ